MEFMRCRLRCSNKRISSAIKSLESRGEIRVLRNHGRNNRYIPTPSKNEVTPTRVEENKEQEINIERRRAVLSKIFKLISSGTGDNVFLIQQIFTGRGLTEDELEVMAEKIALSDFLMGKQDTKPTIRHYDSPKQIDKVRFGYYRNNAKDEKKNKVEEVKKAPYHYEFQEKEEVEYEPND
ncbi:MAG: hypothetical protein ACRCZ9_04250, partial [Fusobacteriaceae bacterium]